MPSLPTKTTRRKRATPVAVTTRKDAWSSWLKLYGFQPPTSGKTPAAATMSSAGPISAPAQNTPAQRAQPLTFFDLPIETQKDIIVQCHSADLIALSLVSKHFRDLAAAQLYRNFYIVFPDDDDISYDSQIDGLAGGLDTFATSDYDYAQYLKEVVLDTLSGGAKGERAYRHYTSDQSCGKFMNTLFLLTLRRAKALETFKWDIRVELSRPVYKALHSIPALQHLHVRMHSGTSIYLPPPPLPSLGTLKSQAATSEQIIFLALDGPKPEVQNIKKSKRPFNKKNGSGRDTPKNPPTLSGFKNLKSLAILDMDSLQYVTEIRACIHNSSSTLNKLKLSFSESLARQARKPPAADDTADDSDQEMDEFGNLIPTPTPAGLPTDDVAGPAKAFRAQEERKAQEAVLARIFGTGNALDLELRAKDDGAESPTSTEEGKEAELEFEDAGKTFIRDLMLLSKKLMSATSGTTSMQQQQEVLDNIAKAAKKYVDENSEDTKITAGKGESAGNASEEFSTAKTTPQSSVASVAGKVDIEFTAEDEVKDLASAEESPGMFDEVKKKDRKTNQSSLEGPNPDDIDVYEPEVPLDLQDVDDGTVSELPSAETADSAKSSANTGESEKANVPSTELVHSVELLHIDSLPEALMAKALDLRERAKAALRDSDRVKAEEILLELVKDVAVLDVKAAEMNQLKYISKQWVDGLTKDLLEADRLREKKQAMIEYVRTTRGLALKTLAIYLIPIKASVLSRAIDVHVLKRISLLNVGPQAAFWNLLAKENAISPLPLKKIHTDNVTMPFLNFVNQLDSLVELFILERTSKSTEQSFAPKTTVTNDNIRRLVLKKHMSTLKRLVVNNENDYTWDANERFLELLCRRGKKLEELAISFSSVAVHTFNQYLPGLTALKAIHIINFRNEDTCHWVMREIRKFLVDNVSHHPNMKLEYIALDGNVQRLIRRQPEHKPSDKKGKGKGKATLSATDSAVVFPTLETMLSGAKAEGSNSEESDADDDYVPGLKLETLESGRFHDVYGVRMWRKDVFMGRL